jgi:hypothetical protein
MVVSISKEWKKMMEKIVNKSFSSERALYNHKDLKLNNVSFKGQEDGESALKECENIEVENCHFELRYPLWHCNVVKINNSTFNETSRAALWYSNDINISKSVLNGIKALRECTNISISDTKIVSPEVFWKCSSFNVLKSNIDSEYPFFESKDGLLDHCELKGKYSFQYTKNIQIKNSYLDTKDAFWHSKDCVISDCVIKGEYIGWYSQNLTLIRCTIDGTQPFCYAKNLKLFDCIMNNSDFAFEYSSVHARVFSIIKSVKNPLSGRIVAKGYGEIILKDSKYPTKCKIVEDKNI